jgi:Zn-dependent protease
MRQSLRLGRIAGIPVGIHWSVVVIVALIAWLLGAQVMPAMVPGTPALAYWLTAVPGALLFVAALLAHELAHSFVARRKGVPVKSITLWALGGVSELGGDPPDARADLLIAIAGPATSLAAGAVFTGAAAVVRVTWGPHAAAAALLAFALLYWLAAMNVLLAVFNLLPGAPLDGGRVLRALLWMRHGDRARAARTAATAGRVLAVAVIMFGLFELIVWREVGGLWLVLIGLFLMSAASSELLAQTAATALDRLRVRDVMTARPAIGAGWMSVSDFIDRVALHSTQNIFPVVGIDGALVGVVELAALGRVPPPSRPLTQLRQIAIGVPPAYQAAPDDPAAPVLTRPPLARELAAVVLEEGRIIGLVTVSNLRQVIAREQLREPPLQEIPATGASGGAADRSR